MPDAPILIAFLLLAGVWGFYLFPSVFGHRRDAPLSSTEEFDRWTHLMADVQRRGFSARRASVRDVVRARRRRTILVLALSALAALALAYMRSSINWLLVHIGIDAAIAWYVAMLMQLRQRRAQKAARHHSLRRPSQADEPPVRIIAH